MYLSELLSSYTALRDVPKIWIKDIAYRVRDIKTDGTAFFYFESFLDHHDWVNKIDSAIKKKITILVLDASDPFYDYTEIEKKYGDKVAIVPILFLSKYISQIAAKFFQYPQNHLRLIGVTGTNGKTSVTHITAQALNNFGTKVGIISSVGNGIISSPLEKEPLTGFRAGYTTPPSIKIFRILSEFVANNVDVAIIEITSHALAWGSVSAINFEVAVLTNITDDHLEYHGNMLSYINTKKKLFDISKNSSTSIVLNYDDKIGRVLQREALNNGKKVITYSAKASNEDFNHPNIFARNITQSLDGLQFEAIYNDNIFKISSPFLGSFYVDNILASIACLIALKIPFSDISRVFSKILRVPGRMELFSAPDLPYAIIDFAHNFDGIEKCLQSIKEIKPARKIHVISGVSDATPENVNQNVADIISKYADEIVITLLNAYSSENIDQILKKFRNNFDMNKNILCFSNRKEAISYAIKSANKNDVVIIIGKGVQDYVLYNGKLIPHNDVEFIKTIYNRGPDVFN